MPWLGHGWDSWWLSAGWTCSLVQSKVISAQSTSRYYLSDGKTWMEKNVHLLQQWLKIIHSVVPCPRKRIIPRDGRRKDWALLKLIELNLYRFEHFSQDSEHYYSVPFRSSSDFCQYGRATYLWNNEVKWAIVLPFNGSIARRIESDGAICTNQWTVPWKKSFVEDKFANTRSVNVRKPFQTWPSQKLRPCPFCLKPQIL
jgi:hypothetical protein